MDERKTTIKTYSQIVPPTVRAVQFLEKEGPTKELLELLENYTVIVNFKKSKVYSVQVLVGSSTKITLIDRDFAVIDDLGLFKRMDPMWFLDNYAEIELA